MYKPRLNCFVFVWTLGCKFLRLLSGIHVQEKPKFPGVLKLSTSRMRRLASQSKSHLEGVMQSSLGIVWGEKLRRDVEMKGKCVKETKSFSIGQKTRAGFLFLRQIYLACKALEWDCAVFVHHVSQRDHSSWQNFQGITAM